MTFLILLGSAALVVVGAEILVRSASTLARRLGVPSLVVGLTVVAYGTSTPELTVSISAALEGVDGVALGNVVGSNIFNILAILGVSAIIVPLTVSSSLIRSDIPIMMLVSIGSVVPALDGRISRAEGLTLLAGLVAYTLFLVYSARRTPAGPAGTDTAETAADPSSATEAPAPPGGGLILQIVLVAVGLAILVVGAEGFTDAAVEIATGLGVSPLVIGLTIVAAGTSLPEAATSIAAALRGERDIAVGNVVGSNIFNLLAVLGGAAAVSEAGIAVAPGALTFDIPVMIGVAVVVLPMALTHGTIGRGEGVVLLAFYLGYTVYLGLDATGHASAEALRTAVFGFAAPLTFVALTAAVIRGRRAGRDR